ncbi:MAG: efflux RND transporter periplasmic adaptor subunit [Desulfobacterales bacterium]|nr:efflux RND transporter periplasmic adaptor subunit [Desulfobacterales bacterium]
MKKKYLFWLLGGILVAGSAGGYTHFYRKKTNAAQYRIAQVERGDISSRVTANGTVNPVITVLVGSQVSGTILNLYADFNTAVKKGQVIAQIDPAIFQAQLSQTSAKVQNAMASISNAEADIGTARSNLDVSKANVVKAKVAVADTRRNLDRNLELFGRNLIAVSEKDTAQTAYDSALAQLEAVQAQQGAAQAQVESSRARLASARAALKQVQAERELSQLNLDHSRITAPVNGTVISRNVDVGQTVAASLQAPTLFTIAQDLTDMQVETNVSEADIGRISEGQETTFTVDAYPQNIFRGRVTEIRNAPVTVQNVVSYIVVIRVKNPEKKLRPGMTANASILVAQRDDILKIPNAALRFRPEFAKRPSGSGQKAGAGKASSKARPSGPRNQERLPAELNLTSDQRQAAALIFRETRSQIEAAGGDQEKIRKIREESRPRIRALLNETQQQKYDQMARRPEDRHTSVPVYRVWLPVEQKEPVPVEITTGISDGIVTEVLSGDLKEDQEVIVDVAGGSPNRQRNPSSGGMPGSGGAPGFGGRR